MKRARIGALFGGLPYNRLGRGPCIAVALLGLTFENRPLAGMELGMVRDYATLAATHTIYLVNRRPGLPVGASLADMAADCAAMIREEFGGPVDVIGQSTGGSIAQHLAADHPAVVRRLVLHSSAHTLSEPARALQLQVAGLAEQRLWRQAWQVLLRYMMPPRWYAAALAGLGANLLALSPPRDPSDLVITVAAEDQHAFQSRLGEIEAPTLVVAGANDPFYTPALFRETAAGIPQAKLVLYEHMGHPATGRQFRHELAAFLAP